LKHNQRQHSQTSAATTVTASNNQQQKPTTKTNISLIVAMGFTIQHANMAANSHFQQPQQGSQIQQQQYQ
jgi:hypothetical protein